MVLLLSINFVQRCLGNGGDGDDNDGNLLGINLIVAIIFVILKYFKHEKYCELKPLLSVGAFIFGRQRFDFKNLRFQILLEILSDYYCY